MNELLNNIDKHKLGNDAKSCYILFDVIERYQIKNIEELKKIEDMYFRYDGEILTNEEIRLELKYNSYLTDITHFDKLDSDSLDKLTELSEKYNKTNNIEEKYKYIIIMYSIMNWTMYFPYQAYKLILEDKLI